jgi:para-nitrobenzyl esterase
MRARAIWALAAVLSACGGTNEATTQTTADATLGDAADVTNGVDVATGEDAAPDVQGCPVVPSTEAGVIATDRGQVRGALSNGAWAWKGIPFAAPPIGDQRFRDPQPAACWTGIRDSQVFGAKCLQKDAASGQTVGAEDCLTLNVFAPPNPPTAKMPVLVFIHGGGNIQGSAAETIAGGKPIYAGEHLAAATNALVVTIQYRLGPFGWLSLPELTAERGAKSGNQGLRDQIAALTWVQANIGAFGGDPQKVLVFGESAGAVDVCALMAAPSAKGLFAAALMESGGCTQPKQDAAETAQGDKAGQGSCAKVADRLQCLRGMDAAQLLSEMPGSIGIGDASFTADAGKYGPVVDGALLPQNPIDALAAGAVNQVPFVVGCNGDELAKLLTVKVTTDAELQTALAAMVGTLGGDAVMKVQAMYAATKFATPQDALVAAYSDLRFVCPSRAIARNAAQTAKFPVWRYFFTRQAPTLKGPIPASHGIELLYVFGSLNDIVGYKPAAADVALSQAMMAAWGGLAAKGTPDWAPWVAADDAYMEFGDVAAVKQGVHTAACDLWGTLVPGY